MRDGFEGADAPQVGDELPEVVDPAAEAGPAEADAGEDEGVVACEDGGGDESVGRVSFFGKEEGEEEEDADEEGDEDCRTAPGGDWGLIPGDVEEDEADDS